VDDAAARRLGRRVIHGLNELVEVIQKLQSFGSVTVKCLSSKNTV
jgi:hypothetical protein